MESRKAKGHGDCGYNLNGSMKVKCLSQQNPNYSPCAFALCLKHAHDHARSSLWGIHLLICSGVSCVHLSFSRAEHYHNLSITQYQVEYTQDITQYRFHKINI